MVLPLNIAGLLSKQKNTAGLMPHPERAIETWMGSTDGRSFLKIWSFHYDLS